MQWGWRALSEVGQRLFLSAVGTGEGTDHAVAFDGCSAHIGTLTRDGPRSLVSRGVGCLSLSALLRVVPQCQAGGLEGLCAGTPGRTMAAVKTMREQPVALVTQGSAADGSA